MHLDEILRAPRWAPLARFVGRWYAEPLGAEGLTEADLDRAEASLGRPLPRAVREWFRLVGHRFHDVNQDQAVRLDQLHVEDDRLAIWWENQGNWSFDVELEPRDEEPWVSVESDEPGWCRRDRLCRALLGMVYSDTLVGVWSGRGVGPLGPLAASVVGGYRDGAPREVDARVVALPALDVVTNPYFDTPLRGHEALVIRGYEGMWEWMAATDEAHREALVLLDLGDADGPRHLVIVLDPVPPDAHDPLRAILDGETGPLGGLGRLRTARYGLHFDRATLELETRDPEAALAALRAHLPPSAVAVMRAGHRPRSTMRFVPCWPPGATEFLEPI